jgi:hypothetical protein
MQALVVERQKQIDIADFEIERVKKELDYRVRKPAEAEKYRLQKLAEADRIRCRDFTSLCFGLTFLFFSQHASNA